MNITAKPAVLAALSASLLLSIPVLNAQDAPPPPPPAQGGAATATAPGQGGAPNPQDFVQRILDMRDANIKTTLKVTDDEWAVIQPLLDKVQKIQFANLMQNAGGMGFMRRGGGGGNPNGANGGGDTGGGPARPQMQGSPESQALSTAVQSDATSDNDLKAKMDAVRAARKKADDELAAARADLQKVLTVRQEAVLLNMGILN